MLEDKGKKYPHIQNERAKKIPWAQRRARERAATVMSSILQK